MRTKSTFTTIVIVLALSLTGGCAVGQSSGYRSPSEIFFDVTETVLDMFETSELSDWHEENRTAFENRRKWQCENLSASELRDLGVTK